MLNSSSVNCSSNSNVHWYDSVVIIRFNSVTILFYCNLINHKVRMLNENVRDFNHVYGAMAAFSRRLSRVKSIYDDNLLAYLRIFKEKFLDSQIYCFLCAIDFFCLLINKFLTSYIQIILFNRISSLQA